VSCRIRLNGQLVESPVGATILSVALAAGVKIPTLCHDPRLSSPAQCRMCLVEIKGKKNLTASCITPVEPGMDIQTHSDVVMTSRRETLRLLLASHPKDCLGCVQTGDCRLQDFSVEHGVGFDDVVTEQEHPRSAPDLSHPLLALDPAKCVKCGLCIRVCDEIQGQQVWGWIGRGSELRAGFAGATLQASGCVSCGACSAICPTGAITDKNWIAFQARPWQTRVVETVCTYCGVGCALTARVKDGIIVNVSADPKRAPNFGHLCVKGRYGFTYLTHPDRLTRPLIRQDRSEEFRPVSWDEALGEAAERLKAVVAKWGPDAVGILSSSRGTNEENYLAQKLARAVVGTHNIDNCARVCHAPSVVGMRAAFGSGAATNPLSDVDGAEVIIVCGSNTTEAHPVMGAKIKQAARRGAKLILVDPRAVELIRCASVHLALKPGTNIALINSLIAAILDEGLENKTFIAERTEGFEWMDVIRASYQPEEMESVTSVPAASVRQAARWFASTKKGMILYGLGITEQRDGSQAVMALANLSMVTGNVGRPHTGLMPLRGQNNVQGSCDVGALPNYLPGYQSYEDAAVREKFERAWSCALSRSPGLKEPEMYDRALDGRFKALIVIGYDPAATQADLTRVRAALAKLECMIVVELFPTATTEMAHVVLPAASSFEKDGTFTNAERRVRRLHKVVDPPGEAKADWEIVCRLSAALGTPMPYGHPSEVMDEMAALMPMFQGLTYARLEGEGVVWPADPQTGEAVPVLHQGRFTRGKGLFHDMVFNPPEEQPTDAYPFILITGRRLTHHNNGSMTRRSTGLMEVSGGERLEIHPEDAGQMGIKSGQRVKVISSRGHVTVEAEVTTRVQKGNLFMSFHFPETPVNVLTGAGEDAVARTPNYKVTPVRIDP